MQYIGGVRPEVGPEVVRDLCVGQLGQIFFDLMFLVAPGKVGVGLRKAQLCQLIHHFGTSEGLG